MPDNPLQIVLKKLRKRIAAVGMASSVGWAVTAAIVLLLICVWLDLALILSPQLRVFSEVIAVVCALIVIVRGAWAILHRCETSRLARQLDRTGGSAGQIRSGVDLLLNRAAIPRGGTSAPPPRHAAALTTGLADIAIERAQTLAAAISETTAVPTRPMWTPACTFLTLMGAIGLFAVFMPRLVKTEWLRFADPHGDHPPFSRTIFHVEPGHARVVYGTGFDINVRTEGPPLEHVELVVRGVNAEADQEEVLPMFPEMSGQWRATVAQVISPATYHVRAQRARSERFKIGVITIPKLESVRFRITSPAYTHKPDYEGPLPNTGLAGLPGTRVTVWARSNRQLSGGPLDVTAGSDTKHLDLQPIAAGSMEATGSFEIRQAGKLRLRVRDSDGQVSTEELATPIGLLNDERPFIRLAEPQATSLATPTVNLPVVIQAEDDYGVSRIQLYRSLNDSRPIPVDVKVSTSQPARVEDTVQLPLGEYGLQPGDVIKLFARVEDNDPAGAKGFESDIVMVRIISQEDLERMTLTREGIEALMSKYEQANRRMEAIEKEIEKLQEDLAKLPPDSPLAQEKRDQLAKLAEKMEKEAKAIAESAKSDLPYDLDQALKKNLGDMAKKMQDLAKQTKSLSQKPGLSASGALDELKKIGAQCSGGKKDYKKDVKDPLEHLAAIYPLMEDQARYVLLYQRQQALAERMADLEGKNDQSSPAEKTRMRDLEREQREIREDLTTLLDEIEAHVALLPEDPRLDKLRNMAKDFARDVRKSGATEAQQDAESGLAEFAGTRAHQSAVKAVAIMNKFIGRCQGTGKEGSMCLKFQPSLSAGLGNTVEQLLANAGLLESMGSNMGRGSGGGHSSQRSTMDNVGLYGKSPSLGDVSSAGGKEARRGGQGHGNVWKNEAADPALHGEAGKLRGAGAGEATVPAPYRQRVGKYFERVAEELGQK